MAASLGLRADDRAHLEDSRHAHFRERPVPVEEVLFVANCYEIRVLVFQAEPDKPFKLLRLIRLQVLQPLASVEDEEARPPALHDKLSARRYYIYGVSGDRAMDVPYGLSYIVDRVVPYLRVKDVGGDTAELRRHEGVEHRRLTCGRIAYNDRAAVAEKYVEEPRRLPPADIGKTLHSVKGKRPAESGWSSSCRCSVSHRICLY